MPLSLHDRLATRSPIPDYQDALLRQHFQGRKLKRSALISLKQYLNDLRDQRYWLSCDCQLPDSPPPLLSLRRTQRSITLVRHGSTPHARTCPFFREAPALEDSAEEEDHTPLGHETPLLPNTGSFLTLGGAASALPSDTARQRHGPRRATQSQRPELAVNLMTLIDKAGLNVISPGEIIAPRDQAVRPKDLRRQYAKLDVGLDQPITPTLSLGDVTCTHLSRVPRFLARFRQHLEPLFPEDIRPQGLAVFPVDDYEPNGRQTRLVLHRGGEELLCQAYGVVRRYGPTNTPGPLWFIGQVGREGSTGLYEILSGYLHPVFSKTILMPVDSDLERRVASHLMGLVSYWSWKHGVVIQLKKPVFDEIASNGEWHRPDFTLLMPDGRRLVVEVMGSDDPDYLRRKVMMCETLAEQATVVDVVRWGVQSDPVTMGRVLTAAVLRTAESSTK